MISLRLLPLLLIFTLSGCASWIATMSDQPVDQYHGTRTLGAKIEDSRIERTAYINALRATPELHDNGRLVVVSWNGQVLLTGQVASDASRQQIAAAVEAVRHVLHVHNELQTGQPISFLARSSDAGITFRVKMRLLFGPDVPGQRVKVVTENGVVYLMGLLTQDESSRVVAEASKVYGIQKIVKIFEYIEPKNAAR